METRLQKYLADCGVASRRKSEELILSGEIKVNGEIVKELGIKINPDEDRVEYKSEIIKPKNNNVYIMLNKPEGYVSSAKDQFGRETVIDLIESDMRVYPVGRLDYDSSGLILLTNDGELTYKITHPKNNIPKRYTAKVLGTPSQESLTRFRNGLIIDDYKTAPAEIEIIERDYKYSLLKIVIHEGKNRQIRKMCDSIGHKVISLKRVAIGELSLGKLQKGKYRHLTSEEVRYLKDL
ncbi:MAG: rRNA pseudouridine synthase [Defluviitaleaceae bacterium]|nr:rRNA pseudouridine synthase [Defluviitaleaceae bacterium]